MKRILNSLIRVCLLISIATLNNCKKEETNLPVLITVPASDIKATSALLGGQIAYDGGAEVIDRGICWGTESNPDISCSKKTNGMGTGSFTCTLIGLSPTTLYYARAFATNSKGTAYGGEIRFTTISAKAPVVLTLVTNNYISYYNARVGGQVTDDGGAPVIEKGICWATVENPTIINNNKVPYNEDNYDDYYRNDYGSYWCFIDQLQPESVYHIRAYAINIVDTSYGDNVSITTLSVPEITTFAATEVTANSATVGGNVISYGDAPTDYYPDYYIGICYGINKDPLFEGPHIDASGTTSDPITGTGEFTCNLTNLTPGTIYYARAYVHWSFYEGWEECTIYGNEVTFTTKSLGSGKYISALYRDLPK